MVDLSQIIGILSPKTHGLHVFLASRSSTRGLGFEVTPAPLGGTGMVLKAEDAG